ncbi:486_t:CDS:2 [Ambispora leptoticha]|uniref:486_t:CDS:1 n=1 Tax=Ambispora leptoticha TaxID=144679 RepID=A0A9N9BVY9_9GLOM|nr:486_t:CDS:2 [Ambispora leptoticha]
MASSLDTMGILVISVATAERFSIIAQPNSLTIATEQNNIKQCLFLKLKKNIKETRDRYITRYDIIHATNNADMTMPNTNMMTNNVMN